MGIFQKWSGDNRIQDMSPKGVCTNCSGKGFYQYGLEFLHIHECTLCDGSGEVNSE